MEILPFFYTVKEKFKDWKIVYLSDYYPLFSDFPKVKSRL